MRRGDETVRGEGVRVEEAEGAGGEVDDLTAASSRQMSQLIRYPNCFPSQMFNDTQNGGELTRRHPWMGDQEKLV